MEWISLESRQNPAVKLCASLEQKKARDENDLFVAEGKTLFFDFAQKGLFPKKVFLSQKALSLRDQLDSVLGKRACSCYLLPPFVFEKITSEKGSEGIVSLYSVSDLHKILTWKKKEKFIALENVQDPGNLGTVLRTAAALSFDGVLLVGGADPLGSKAVRASMGAIARIPVQSFEDTASLFRFLKNEKIRSVAATLSSDSVLLPEADLSAPICVLIGNEGKGLSALAQSEADFRCIIPIEGMESLNAAVAASIFMWEIQRRRNE